MARALWKGAISFGLVNIPVEMYSAEDRKSFSFSMLDKRDLSPVGYKRYNKSTGKEVAWGDIVKGYEYSKDEYVVLSEEDFKQANVKATQTIDIRAFVDAGEIPLEYYETPYYLAPAQRGGKVYALLRETLKETGRVAVAEVVLRTTPHLGVVYPNEKALMFNTLRYRDELKDASGIELPPAGLKSAGVTAKEVELAKRLVDDMTEEWDPSQYKNTYHDDLMKRIEEKVKAGQATEITKPSKEGTHKSAQVIDLAELLKKSLGTATTKKPVKRAAASHAKRKRA
jgi:DNA end-binding protein Ku